jgi:predicted MPP superfamily phosphohydrolase
MISFLITFLTLYGGMHAYVFFRIWQTFSPEKLTAIFLAGWMLLMVSAPLMVHQLEEAGLDQAATLIAWPGYIWIGFIFIFCASLATVDTLRITAWLANHLCGTAVPGILGAAFTCQIALVLALLASCYALYEARRIRTDYVTVSTSKLKPSDPPVRIVQISDVHLGLLFRESRLDPVIQTIRSLHPDILVSTGDLVDGRLSRDHLSHMNRMAAMIDSIPTKIGKFAINGNHEFYAGLNQAQDFTRKAGFTILRNNSIPLLENITISGIDDPAGKQMGLSIIRPPESELLRSVPTNRFRILLKHRPNIPETSDGLFDLQLSGHVHKGQIFPFNLLVRLEFAIPCGTTITQHGSMIHVSRGTGTWGPPMRLLAPPEVTVIDIVPQT